MPAEKPSYGRMSAAPASEPSTLCYLYKTKDFCASMAIISKGLPIHYIYVICSLSIRLKQLLKGCTWSGKLNFTHKTKPKGGIPWIDLGTFWSDLIDFLEAWVFGIRSGDRIRAWREGTLLLEPACRHALFTNWNRLRQFGGYVGGLEQKFLSIWRIWARRMGHADFPLCPWSSSGSWMSRYLISD
jgi:hypothetical protein